MNVTKRRVPIIGYVNANYLGLPRVGIVLSNKNSKRKIN